MKKFAQYRLIVLALTLSALVHLTAVFYETQRSESLVSDGANAIVVSIELVAAHSKSVGDKNKQTIEPIKNKKEFNSEKNVSRVINEPADVVVEKHADVSMPVNEENNETEQEPDVLLSTNDKADEFLKLVYVEINKYKHYPYQARRQRREGNVKLNFILHPDGRVSEVVVVESSRFHALDRAARQAVESISPFLIAANYLHAETEFNVDIDYRLN